MKIGHRLSTATTFLLVTTVAIYAFFDFKKSSQERRQNLQDRTQDVALALRSAVELSGYPVSQEDAETIARDLSRSNAPWEVRIFSADYLDHAPPGDSVTRAKNLISTRSQSVPSTGEEEIRYLLPLRSLTTENTDGIRISGTLELAHSTHELRESDRNQMIQIAIMIVVLFALIMAALLLLSRILITRPIHKLLAGVDDVAHGDLSHVLLAEREDEIGSLAARFNAMTKSLRESRAETQKQNQARGRLENRLFQTEKMATIGQIAAEIAHEVGTPLNVIAGRARTMEKKSSDPNAVEKNAHIIAEQAGRITRIIQRLLDFSRRKVGSIENGEVDINNVAKTTMTFLEGKLNAASVKHSMDLEEHLPKVTGNADQLQQVLLNLLINAAEAMPDGGELRLTSEKILRRRPGLESAPEHSMVQLTITDTGHGIPKTKQEKIFEPFYSTKQSAGGTGLGLAVVHGIVKEHDGWVEIAESSKQGTQFRVVLPALA